MSVRGRDERRPHGANKMIYGHSGQGRPDGPPLTADQLPAAGLPGSSITYGGAAPGHGPGVATSSSSAVSVR